MKGLRGVWLRVHRWLALSAGWILLFSGLSGAALVVTPALDRWTNPQLFQARTHLASGQAGVALESVLRSARQEFGDGANLVFRPARGPGETLEVRVRGGWRGTLYLDPATGAEQGRRGETEGAANVLFKLHSALYLDGTGKAILAWVALAYLFLLITGLILWWPRHWAKGWNIALNKGLLRSLFDLHRVGGATLGLLIAVSVASGAYMAWRPLGAAVTWVSGATPIKAPKLPPATAEVSPDAQAGQALSLDQLAAKAVAQFQEPAPIGYIVVPPHANAPTRFRMMLGDDPHPNGMSSVWIDPRTAQVLAVQRWNTLDPGARATAVIYPLHTGELGGLALEIAVAIGGLTLGGLGISGVWLWWRRRSIKRGTIQPRIRQGRDRAR
ncbi:MAG: PepSY-associated TM helix domain-containing protein [Achromobacter pestifer]